MDSDIDCGGCDGCDCGDCGDCNGCDSGCCDSLIFYPTDCNGCSLKNFFQMLFWISAFFGVIFGISTCGQKTEKGIKQEIESLIHEGTIVDTYWSFRMFDEDSTTVVEDANKQRFLLKGKRGKEGEEITFTKKEVIK